MDMKKISSIIVSTILIYLFFRPGTNSLMATPTVKYIRNGKASWYSRNSPGINRRTANNEIFDDKDMTCAMWGASFNRLVKVTNLQNGKSIIVRVNDRGPHRRYVEQGRVVDLTIEAFSHLEVPEEGLIDVAIEFL